MTVTTTSATDPQINADDVSAQSGTSGTPDSSQGLIEARDRYRSQRDTAREELATAAAHIERMNRREIERLASEHLAQGSDLLSMSGNELTAYLNEETGEVDADRIRTDALILLEERPGLGKHAPAFDPTQGTGGNAPGKPSISWSELLKN